MNKLLYLTALIAAAIVLTANTASAAVRNVDPVKEPCIYQTIDACFHEGDWWYSTTSVGSDGQVHDLIDCGLSEGCKFCGTTAAGKPQCIIVNITNGGCSCSITPVPGAGPNIVQCELKGVCQYRF